MIAQELEHQNHREPEASDEEVIAPEIGEEEGVVEEDQVVEGTNSQKIKSSLNDPSVFENRTYYFAWMVLSMFPLIPGQATDAHGRCSFGGE